MRVCFIFSFILIFAPLIVENNLYSSSDSLSQELRSDTDAYVLQIEKDAEYKINEMSEKYESVKQDLEIIMATLNKRRVIWMTESFIVILLLVTLILVLINNSRRNKSKNLAIIRQMQEVQQMIGSKRKSEFHFLFSDFNREKDYDEDSNFERYDFLFEKLQDLMVNERLYLNPNLGKEHVLKLLKTDSRSLSVALKNNLSDSSFSNYITSLRVSEAIFLLENAPQHTIEEVSEKVGFYTCRTFYRQFKKKFDMTPAEYRKLTLYN